MIESIKSNIRSSLSLQEEVIKYKFKHPVEYDSLEQIKISKMIGEGNKRVVKTITHQYVFRHYAYIDFSYVRLPIKAETLEISYSGIESVELGDIFATLKHTNLQYVYNSKRYFQRITHSLDWYGHIKNRKERIKDLC